MLLLPTSTIPYEGPYTLYRLSNYETGESVDRNPPSLRVQEDGPNHRRPGPFAEKFFTMMPKSGA